MIKVFVGNNIRRNAVIIDENTTLRATLEDAGVDYTVGTTSLDGSSLAPGDLDKTFADFGVTEKCYLLNVVKVDNAATAKILGSACVLTSTHSLETIKLVQKYRPNSLCLYDGEGRDREEVFRVGITTKNNGTVNKFGVGFSDTPGADQKATVTMMIPDGTPDPKAWAEENLGGAILMLTKVESQITSVLEEINQEKAKVSQAITVVA